MSKDNKALKRASQMLLPFIPELPDWETEVDNCDTDDVGEESSDDTLLLLENQAKIAGQGGKKTAHDVNLHSLK